MRSYLKIGLPAAAAGILLLSAACGQTHGNRTGANAYHNDGLLGTTNANPNAVTNPGYHNYRADTDLVRNTLSRIRGVRDATIIMSGSTIFVTLQLSPGISPQEAQQVQAVAQDEVSRTMPRYNVRVKAAGPKR